MGIRTTLFKFFGLSTLQVFIAGSVVGYAALLPVLYDAKVYHNKCNQSNVNETECLDQTRSVVNVASTAFLMYNIFAFPLGVINDFIGHNTLGIISASVWTIATAVSGILPETGTLFLVGYIFSTIAAGNLFTITMSSYASGLSPKRFPTLSHAVLTGLWDFGSMTYVLLALIYFLVPHRSFWVLYLCYGLIIGVPAIAFLIYTFPSSYLIILLQSSRTIKIGNERLDWQEFKSQLAILLRVLKTRLFWVLTMSTSCVVVYGYFWIPLVVEHMMWHGADQDTAMYYNKIFSILLPVVGTFSSFITGFTINFSNKNSIIVAFLLQIIFAMLCGIFAVKRGPFWHQYIAFIGIILWRVHGFALANSLISAFYPSPKVLGKTYGAIYSISGILGIINVPLNQVPVRDAASFLYIHISFTAMSVLISTFAIIFVLRDLNDKCESKEFLGEVEHEDATAMMMKTMAEREFWYGSMGISSLSFSKKTPPSFSSGADMKRIDRT